MGISLVRNPPVDASAGFMSVRFVDSGHIACIEKFHTNTVDPAQISTEFGTLASFLQPFYNSAWDIQLTALTQNTGGVLQRIAVPTATGGGFLHHGGTGSTATAGAEGFIQTILTFDTVDNGKARVRLCGVGGQGIDVDSMVDADPAGSPLEALVNYLVNTTTHIIAHDGSKLKLPCHVTYALMDRARRAAMRVA